MRDLGATPAITRVSDRLTSAWTFLSGEQRAFSCQQRRTELLHYASFSIFMPVEVPEYAKKGGVAVLIQQDDAIRVASHMFGVARQDIQYADLKDACAEVCNVMCDCIADQFSGGEEFSIGLPWIANHVEYQYVADNSVVRAIYQSTLGAQDLFVVLYDGLSPSP